jgi:hypothetical protein
MEPVRFVPLYFVAPQSIIIVTEPSFVSTPIHIIDGVRSRTQIPRRTKFVSVHEDIPRKVNKVFVSQPLDLGGCDSDPLGPPRPPRLPRYFGLPMVNPSRPPSPPNTPYCRPLNYLEYVKDFDPNAHVRILKVPL